MPVKFEFPAGCDRSRTPEYIEKVMAWAARGKAPLPPD